MITIEAIATVTTEGQVTIKLPSNIPPGEHKMVLIVDEKLRKDQTNLIQDEAWDQFDQLIDRCIVDTGIEDLAHQHDHYFHGTPKREVYP